MLIESALTQGYLLTLDKPDKIKLKYGVGYKLLIEPKLDFISQDEFLEKKIELDTIILNASLGIKENSDSTSKKLVYQIPF